MIDPRSPEHNYVTVRGIKSPGVAQVSGAEAPHNYQVQEGFGLSGATMTYRGPGIAHPVVTLRLWLPEHFVQWEVFKKVLTNPTPLKPFYVEMGHPILANAGIKAVGIENIGEPVRAPNGGAWIATIKLIQWKPVKVINFKADKSVPDAEKGKPEAPKTAAQRAAVEAVKGLEDALTDGRTKKKPGSN